MCCLCVSKLGVLARFKSLKEIERENRENGTTMRQFCHQGTAQSIETSQCSADKETELYPLDNGTTGMQLSKEDLTHVVLTEKHVRSLIEEVGLDLIKKNMGLLNCKKCSGQMEAQLKLKNPPNNSFRHKEMETPIDSSLATTQTMQEPQRTVLSREELEGYTWKTPQATVEYQTQQGASLNEGTENRCMQITRFEESIEAELVVDSGGEETEVGESSDTHLALIEDPIPFQINEEMSEQEIEDKASLWVHSNVLKLSKLFWGSIRRL
ncbi:hypothetical protein HAX54_027931 [Datura stramonium]|uniref:Uncharacterized protein n=1 Tax=Datura stramonium TaxID=4076 RepID=A0ABS8S973_DATST|nr:hypothetical protein [Datura stramonium]